MQNLKGLKMMEGKMDNKIFKLETGIRVKVSIEAGKREVHVKANRNLRDHERSDLIGKIGLPTYGWTYFENGMEKGTIVVKVV